MGNGKTPTPPPPPPGSGTGGKTQKTPKPAGGTAKPDGSTTQRPPQAKR